MILNVFFSHDQDDIAIVRRIKEKIEGRGRTHVYIHEDDFRLGDSLSEAMQDEIRKADIVIALLTPNSATSMWVNREIGFAVGEGRQVIPIMLEGTDKRAVRALLGDVRYVVFDPNNPKAFFERFLGFIDTQANAELQAEAIDVGADIVDTISSPSDELIDTLTGETAMILRSLSRDTTDTVARLSARSSSSSNPFTTTTSSITPARQPTLNWMDYNPWLRYNPWFPTPSRSQEEPE